MSNSFCHIMRYIASRSYNGVIYRIKSYCKYTKLYRLNGTLANITIFTTSAKSTAFPAKIYR